MRLCLFWNATAGRGSEIEDVVSAITAAGHTIVTTIQRPDELLTEHLDGVDAVVAAGGDGTVARVGRLLAGRNLPMAILPYGTANNIATSLNISVDDDPSRWSRDRIERVDIGRTDNGQSFLESLGCGLVCECIVEGQRTLAKDDPDAHLPEARQMYVDQLQDYRARHYRITLDNETIEGDYLVIEVLNTARVGPGVELATNVSANDGALSVVMLGESDRCELHRYLTALRDGQATAGPFTARRARTVTIEGADCVHIDDRVIDSSAAWQITIGAGSLGVLR